MKTNRTDFNQTWLTEMPILGGSFDTFRVLTDAIKDVKLHVTEPQELEGGLKKIQYDREVFYWYEADGQIQLGVIMNVYPRRLEVTLLGKNPQLRSQPPYATDLYTVILKDQPGAKIFSDVELSIPGFRFWENMMRAGHAVSVYDTTDKKYIKIKDIRDFNKYTGPDAAQRYRYVLSRATTQDQSLNEIQRIAKLAGAPPKSQQ